MGHAAAISAESEAVRTPSVDQASLLARGETAPRALYISRNKSSRSWTLMRISCSRCGTQRAIRDPATHCGGAPPTLRPPRQAAQILDGVGDNRSHCCVLNVLPSECALVPIQKAATDRPAPAEIGGPTHVLRGLAKELRGDASTRV